MLRYIGRRLLQTIPVFFGATFLIFALALYDAAHGAGRDLDSK